MAFDCSQAFRYAMDFSLAVTNIVAVTPYQVYLINIVNDQIDITDTSANRVVTQTRILMADGYRSYAPFDGYLNPIVQQEDGSQLVLSNGQLTSNKIMVGPIVFPYTLNNFSGGTDIQLFQPSIGNNNNTQIYIQIRGDALSPKGNFFDIKEAVISDMGGLSYRLICEATSSVEL
jgi:hypothetical protein